MNSVGLWPQIQTVMTTLKHRYEGAQLGKANFVKLTAEIQRMFNLSTELITKGNLAIVKRYVRFALTKGYRSKRQYTNLSTAANLPYQPQLC